MSAEVVKGRPAEVAPLTWARVTSVRMVESVPFMGTESLGIQPTAANRVTVWPARLEADGSVVRIGANQRADGLALERPYVERTDNSARCERIFVPWSNIKSVSY